MFKKIAFYLAIAAGALCLIVGALMLTTYFALKSPAMQKRIVNSMESKLAEAGVKLSFKQLSVDLLAGVKIDELNLDFTQPGVNAQIKAPYFRLQYAVWPLIWRQMLVVNEAELRDANIDVNIEPEKMQNPSASTSTEPAAPNPRAINDFVAMLRKPPLSVDLPLLRLRNTDLRLKSQTNISLSDVQAKLDLFETKFRLSPGVLDSDIVWDLSAEISHRAGRELEFRSKLETNANLRLLVDSADKKWNWELINSGIAVTLQDLALRTKSPAKQAPSTSSDLKIANLKWSSTLGLKSTNDLLDESKEELVATDLLLPLELAGKTKLLLAGLKSTQESTGKVPSLSEAMVGLEFGIDHAVSIPAKIADWAKTSWNIDQRLVLHELKVLQNKNQILDGRGTGLSAKGSVKDGLGDLNVVLDASKLQLTGVSSGLDLRVTKKIRLDQPQKKLAVLAEVLLSGQRVVNLDLNLSEKQNVFALGLDAAASLSSKHLKLHPSMAMVEQLGWPTFKLKGFVDADLTKSNIDSDLDLRVEGLRLSSLKTPTQIVQKLKVQTDFADWLKLQVKGETSLDTLPLLNLTFDLAEYKQRLVLSKVLKSTANISQLGKKLNTPIPDIGDLDFNSKVDATLRYNAERLAQVTDWLAADVAVKSKQTLRVPGKHTGAFVRIDKPLEIATDVKMQKLRLLVDNNVKLTNLWVKDSANVRDLSAKTKLGVGNIKNPAAVSMDFNAAIAKVEMLVPALEGFKDFVNGVYAGVKIEVKNQNVLSLKKLSAGFNQNMMAVEASGQTNLATGKGGFLGKASGIMNRAVAGVSGSGGFEIPFQMNIYDKKKFAVSVDPEFKKLNISAKNFELKNLIGRMNIREELTIDESGKIAFLYLNNQNPFARVDYENVDPFLNDGNGLRLESVTAGHVSVGPLSQVFEVQQNLILLNELKANLLNGSIVGRLFVDMQPKNLQLGFLGRFTGLQLELLKAPNLRRKIQDEMSGRMSVGFDVRKRLATGRVDITSIGRNQLLTMIDLLDPEFKDPQMMNARRGLQVAFPRLVGIAMDQGKMDMKIGLDGIVSSDIEVRSIPLTPMIQANAGEALLKVEQLLQD